MDNLITQNYSNVDQSKLNMQNLAQDMKFVSLFVIIYGAISTITLVGALLGIPIIFAGLRLRDAALSLNNYLASNQQYDFDLAIEKQAKAFWIIKILIIVSIIIYVVFFIAFFLILFPMLQHIPTSEL